MLEISETVEIAMSKKGFVDIKNHLETSTRDFPS